MIPQVIGIGVDAYFGDNVYGSLTGLLISTLLFELDTRAALAKALEQKNKFDKLDKQLADYSLSLAAKGIGYSTHGGTLNGRYLGRRI